MVIKTFNLDEEVYKAFSEHCKKNGISMSKRVENFIRDELGRLKVKPVKKVDKVVSEKVKVEHHSFSKYC